MLEPKKVPVAVQGKKIERIFYNHFRTILNEKKKFTPVKKTSPLRLDMTYSAIEYCHRHCKGPEHTTLAAYNHSMIQ